MKLPPVTYTFHRNYENCPRKAWHVNIARDLPKEDSEALRWGNQVHSAMEARINKGTPLPAGMEKYEPFCHFGNFIHKAEVMLGIRENGQPCGFFDSDVWARGKADVVVCGVDALMIFDWKTGKVREEPGELELHAALIPSSEARRSGSYVWLQEMRVGQLHDLSGTQATLERERKVRKEVEHAFKHGRDAFPPRQNPLCGWCPVKSCEFNRAQTHPVRSDSK